MIRADEPRAAEGIVATRGAAVGGAVPRWSLSGCSHPHSYALLAHPSEEPSLHLLRRRLFVRLEDLADGVG